MNPGWKDAGPPDSEPWDAAKADDLIGRLVLVGITYLDPSGEETGRAQFFGHVASADADAGILLKLAGSRDGDRVTLPPDLSALEPAELGIYTLSTTQETVTDPDFTATFRVTRGAEG